MNNFISYNVTYLNYDNEIEIAKFTNYRLAELFSKCKEWSTISCRTINIIDEILKDN